MPWENELFHLDDVLVTDRRFAAGRQSFSLESISTLQVVRQSRSLLPAASTASVAALVGYVAFASSRGNLGVLAGVLAALAVFVYRVSPARYSLAIQTLDGHTVPLRSRSRFFVHGVARVLQTAVKNAAAAQQAHAEPVPQFVIVSRGKTAVTQGEGQEALPARLHAVRRPFSPGKTA